MEEYGFDEFISDIKLYANGYSLLEKAQKNKNQKFIPRNGDQKTGIIGEAYIYQFLLKKGYRNLEYGTASEKGWDIKAELGKKEYKIQVKTVSGFSETRTISPIHDGWDELYLLSLDKEFVPNGLWKINDPNELNWNVKVKTDGEKAKYLIGKKMRKPDKAKGNSGSKELFEKAENIYEDYKKYMGAFLNTRPINP